MTSPSINKEDNSKKEWVFIDESDAIISPAKQSHNNISSDSNITITIPFPPQINPLDLIRRNKNGQLLSRATNKFLIYRNEYSKELQSCGYKLSMRDVSRMAAKSWKLESSEVKRKYEDIAREVEKIHVKLSMPASPYPTCYTRKFMNQSRLHQPNDYLLSVPPFSTESAPVHSLCPHPSFFAGAIRSPSIESVCLDAPINAGSSSTIPSQQQIPYSSLYHFDQSNNYNQQYVPFGLYNNSLNFQMSDNLLLKTSTENNASIEHNDLTKSLVIQDLMFE
ncbi:14321_t:CDS:1 [Acaulospora morrowiae]|uniref:14321_t:CDS:1 n=1 Tax=Acaulospora morrowiae TaxID=94023 RepID=A0A9N9H5M2_9GLOM|nr:14321_t:CDS:1 [Acaulospora morrowiae]